MNAKTLTALTPLLALGLLAGCSQSDSPAPQSNATVSAEATEAPATTPAPETEEQQAAPSTSSAPAKNKKKASGPDEHADLAATPVKLKPTEAIDVAQGEVGKGTVHEISLEFKHRHDAWVYEVELQRGTDDYEIKLDAMTGEILDVDRDSTHKHKHAIDPTKPLSYDDALALAKQKADGRLSEWSLEFDDGSTHYEFEFGDEPNKQEVVVNADTKRAYLD